MRTVDPYGLLQAAGTWYLIGAHRGRPRTYRVSRMVSARVLPQPCRRPEDLDLRRIWQDLRNQYSGSESGIMITLRVGTAWIEMVHRNLTTLLLEPAVITEDGTEMILTGRVPAIRGAAGVLAGFGKEVRVIDPPELIDALMTVADEIKNTYRG